MRRARAWLVVPDFARGALRDIVPSMHARWTRNTPILAFEFETTALNTVDGVGVWPAAARGAERRRAARLPGQVVTAQVSLGHAVAVAQVIGRSAGLASAAAARPAR